MPTADLGLLVVDSIESSAIGNGAILSREIPATPSSSGTQVMVFSSRSYTHLRPLVLYIFGGHQRLPYQKVVWPEPISISQSWRSGGDRDYGCG